MDANVKRKIRGGYFDNMSVLCTNTDLDCNLWYLPKVHFRFVDEDYGIADLLLDAGLLGMASSHLLIGFQSHLSKVVHPAVKCLLDYLFNRLAYNFCVMGKLLVCSCINAYFGRFKFFHEWYKALNLVENTVECRNHMNNVTKVTFCGCFYTPLVEVFTLPRATQRVSISQLLNEISGLDACHSASRTDSAFCSAASSVVGGDIVVTASCDPPSGFSGQ